VGKYFPHSHWELPKRRSHKRPGEQLLIKRSTRTVYRRVGREQAMLDRPPVLPARWGSRVRSGENLEVLEQDTEVGYVTPAIPDRLALSAQI
jgi:hypothetical protein